MGAILLENESDDKMAVFLNTWLAAVQELNPQTTEVGEGILLT
jgi:hypothetical protein